MEQLRTVSKTEKIVFPIVVTDRSFRCCCRPLRRWSVC